MGKFDSVWAKNEKYEKEEARQASIAVLETMEIIK
jgi:hypothetical protein